MALRGAIDVFTPLATALGSISVIAREGFALVVRRLDSFSSCVSCKSILGALPELFLECELLKEL